MKILGIVITDGVGYRNFILSNFINECLLKFDEIIIYSGLPKNCFNDIDNQKIQIKELDIFREHKVNWIFRKLKEVAHMYLHRSSYGINNNLVRGYPANNSLRSLQIKFIYLIAYFFHSEKSICFYEKLQFKSFNKNKITIGYMKLLSENLPNSIFFTHQRPPYLAPFLAVVNKVNLKSISFIFSWDNLASKGRMLGRFDHYFVWSNLMKKEMLHFYPSTKPKDITIVGTPQFEPYVMKAYAIDKISFFKKFELNPAKKTICYSCADAGIGGNDPVHIESIIKFIKQSEQDLQLLVRTSPAEDGIRFNDIKLKYLDIKWNIPKWKLSRANHVETWSQRVPTKEDISDLKSILKFSDLNINMCSTMSLDFMLFDKPVINTVYGNVNNGLYDDQKFLNYDHYKKVVESGAVVIAHNETELFFEINKILENPTSRVDQQNNLLKLQIGKPLEGTSERIANVLYKLSS
ncbi:hypothetical protein [Lutibacter flavus]|uniref:CDP-Glycerol:Poly(Glycerophosphate) glycerophosphotransferase n=1 Tax=Lutibacter flavus TaxID=691689 RepID=A0A238VQK0_9FLAO|nr:hypothetical protein [Lutibacter flavus]SNR36506.1 hypothetical protein SAMN04488111_0877 [Lutibacter flavus]